MPLITTLAGASAKGYGLFGASGPAGSYESIQSYTATGGETSFTFSSIPSTYQHLQLRTLARPTVASASGLNLEINGVTSTSNYTFHRLYGTGSSVVAGGFASGVLNYIQTDAGGGTSTNSAMGATIWDIHDYASTTKNKTVRTINGYDENGAGTIELSSGLFISTNAITSLRVFGITFAAGSIISLYGIKGA